MLTDAVALVPDVKSHYMARTSIIRIHQIPPRGSNPDQSCLGAGPLTRDSISEEVILERKNAAHTANLDFG